MAFALPITRAQASFYLYLTANAPLGEIKVCGVPALGNRRNPPIERRAARAGDPHSDASNHNGGQRCSSGPTASCGSRPATAVEPTTRTATPVDPLGRLGKLLGWIRRRRLIAVEQLSQGLRNPCAGSRSRPTARIMIADVRRGRLGGDQRRPGRQLRAVLAVPRRRERRT